MSFRSFVRTSLCVCVCFLFFRSSSGFICQLFTVFNDFALERNGKWGWLVLSWEVVVSRVVFRPSADHGNEVVDDARHV